MNIEIKLGGFTTTLTLALTDAPVAYDGFQTFTIQQFDYPVAGTRNNARLVAIRTEHLNWQTMRYSSGNNAGIHGKAFDEEFGHFTEADLINLLWNRLTGLNQD